MFILFRYPLHPGFAFFAVQPNMPARFLSKGKLLYPYKKPFAAARLTGQISNLILSH
jgi:hypothetical protein